MSQRTLKMAIYYTSVPKYTRKTFVIAGKFYAVKIAEFRGMTYIRPAIIYRYTIVDTFFPSALTSIEERIAQHCRDVIPSMAGGAWKRATSSNSQNPHESGKSAF